MTTKIITILNHKGGVGKSCSTACIGSALAIKGKHVLLIDLDAQQNLSFMMGHNEDPDVSIYDALVKNVSLQS
jgi:chromosome partitioning protein